MPLKDEAKKEIFEVIQEYDKEHSVLAKASTWLKGNTLSVVLIIVIVCYFIWNSKQNTPAPTAFNFPTIENAAFAADIEPAFDGSRETNHILREILAEVKQLNVKPVEAVAEKPVEVVKPIEFVPPPDGLITEDEDEPVCISGSCPTGNCSGYSRSYSRPRLFRLFR
jgi:hypothetical protein